MQDFSNWFEDKLIQNYTGNRYTLDYQLYIPISDEEKAKCDIKDNIVIITTPSIFIFFKFIYLYSFIYYIINMAK